MHTFAENLSKNNSIPGYHIQQKVYYCEEAIKSKCLSNKNARCISGFLSSYNNEPGVSIIDRLSYELSALEEEKKLRKSSLHKPNMESKSHLYQDATGKCFRQSILECSPAEVTCFSDALKEVIVKLGFTNYKITPIALKHIERTITPASFFTPIKVTDKAVGSPCYMFYIEIRW